jgi:hypothetical protein
MISTRDQVILAASALKASRRALAGEIFMSPWFSYAEGREGIERPGIRTEILGRLKALPAA